MVETKPSSKCGRKQWYITIVFLFVAVIATSLGVFFGYFYGNYSSIPYITPPVKAVVPQGYLISSGFQLSTLDPADIQSRFFTPGPTYVFGILADADSRISDINSKSHYHHCMKITPTAFTLNVFGVAVPFYSQCYSYDSGSTTEFQQWAIIGNTSYLYYRGGETNLAAITTTHSNGTVDVQIWFSVGIININGSRAGVQIIATPNNGNFEMSTGGSGIGYCGAQLKSNNIVLNVTGSLDLGATCNPTDSACLYANDTITAAICTPDVNTFTLTAMGREAWTNALGNYQAPSAYPGGSANQIDCALDASNSIDFGPTTPIGSSS